MQSSSSSSASLARPTTATASSVPAIPPNTREKRNWLIHLLYVRRDFDQCLFVIEEQLAESQLSEYPLYIKALIKRQRGEIAESLALFQSASVLNPGNIHSLKQIARSLYLLGKHKEALGILESVEKLAPEDWEVWHNKGLCLLYIKDYERAAASLVRANQHSRHDSTFLLRARLSALTENYKQAIDILIEAIEGSPENPEILTTLGLLYLRIGENYKAFDYFGNSLNFDPKNPKTILAAGSIIQDHSEVEVALIKYRIAAVATPNSPQLWNNVGMCFFGKQKYVAAIASLKKALYLAPFEWIISFNLGLVHLHTEQYASAFHFFSAAINLKPDFASTYMYLAITLSRLDDFDNACSAYEKAIALENDHIFEINYAITLYNRGDLEKAKKHFSDFEKIFSALDEETKNADTEVLEKRQQLLTVFSPI